MTETQERFLRAVLTRVSPDSIVELHLFPPIRRGTMETGVAVIATVLPPVLSVVEDQSEPEPAGELAAAVEPVVDVDAGDDSVVPVEGELDVATDDVVADEFETLVSVDLSEAAATPVPVPAPRLRILTASYRHTIKGVDRGKWVVDVQEEADAPHEAVEAVLRGVRHRSTEAADPELVAHDSLLALNAPARVAPAA